MLEGGSRGYAKWKEGAGCEHARLRRSLSGLSSEKVCMA